MKTIYHCFLLIVMFFFLGITTTKAQDACDWIYDGIDTDSYLIESDGTPVLFYCSDDSTGIYAPDWATSVLWSYTTSNGHSCINTALDDDDREYFTVNISSLCDDALAGGRVDVTCTLDNDLNTETVCEFAIIFFEEPSPSISISDINQMYNDSAIVTVCEEAMIENMLTLTATGLGSSPPTAEYAEYQWYLGGVAIEGANSVSLEVSNTDYNINNPSSNLFSYSISNFCGDSLSKARNVTIYEGYGEECDSCQWYFPDYEANQFYIFTPNNDGIADYFPEAPSNESNRINEVNDKLSQPTCEATIYRISIYNRLGREVFISEYDNHPWDGKLTNGRSCKEGTYFYKLEYILNPHIPDPEQNQTKVSTGTVYLDSGN